MIAARHAASPAVWSANGSARVRAVAVLAIALAMALQSVTARASAPEEPDSAFVDRVVASLTVDERVGQLVMVNFVGDDVSAQSDIASLVRDFKVGSVIVTSSNGNIVNREDTAAQLAALTNGLQQRASESNARRDGADPYFIPLLIATDNEGDLFPFTNVTNNFTPLPNNMTIGATWSKTHAEETGNVVGRELSAAGVNMLLGPVDDVLDVPRSGGKGDIGIRSFGGSPAWVGELARAYVRGVHAGSGGRMMTVAKHFPGHGGSDRSTDDEVPTVNKSLDQLRQSEFAPFADVVRSAVTDATGTTDAMMVSHIRFRNFLPTAASFTGPISLDPAALAALMNLPEFQKWRSSHLVMSDSLGVPAVKKWYAQQGQPDFPNRTVVKDALMAGSDLLPLLEFYHDPEESGWRTNQLPVIQDSIIYMREQYATDPDFRRRADDAVRHIIAAKVKLYPQLQLAQVLVDPTHASAEAGAAVAEMKTLAEDALTLIQPLTVEDLHARLPRGPVSPEKVLIVECWEDCYPYRVKTKSGLQDELLALYGPSGKARLKAEDVTTISFAELDAWLQHPRDPATAATAKAVNDAAWLIFGLTEYNPEQRPASGAVKRFLDATPVDLRNKTLVAISYNVPYHLDATEISKLTAYFTVYNKTQPAVDAGFHALYGDITPHGHSPVSVSGVSYSVLDAVQPDQQSLSVSVYGQNADQVRDARAIGLVAGPLADHNGNPLADGTIVSFALTREDGATSTATGTTVDGIAGAQLNTSGPGAYTATTSVGIATSKPLSIKVSSSGIETSASPQAESESSSSGSGDRLLVLAAVLGPILLAAAAAVAIALIVRRRRAPVLASQAAIPAGATALAVTPPPAEAIESSEERAAPPAPQLLRVDLDTRRVYVKGNEARPGLSNEQFRLLAYLYERAGKVVGREELVRHIWPDAHIEGVSEEALDALVRRVRERIVQAGGERSYIVTLRGQGFRLEA